MNALDNEMMIENARNVGEHLLSELEMVREKFPDVIGDVRGVGLFVGVELVKDPKTKTPATAETRDVVDRWTENITTRVYDVLYGERFRCSTARAFF